MVRSSLIYRFQSLVYVVYRSRQILYALFYSVSRNGISLVFQFLTTVIIARYLGANAFGQLLVAQSILGLIVGVAGFGIQSIVSREVAVARHQTAFYVGNALLIRTLITLPICLLSALLVSISLGYDVETLHVVLLVALQLWFAGVAGLLFQVLASLDRFDTVFWITLVARIIVFVAMWFLLTMGGSLSQVVLLQILLQIMFAIGAMPRIVAHSSGNWRLLLTWSWSYQRQTIVSGFPLAIAGTSEFASNRFDSFLLGTMTGITNAGQYGAAYAIHMGATSPLIAYMAVFFPHFVRRLNSNLASARHFLHSSILFISIVSASFTFVLWASANYIIIHLYGSEYAEAVTYLKVLVLALPLVGLNRLMTNVLIAMRLERAVLTTIFVGTVANVSLNLWLIPKYFAMGSAVSTVVTEMLVLLGTTITVLVNFYGIRVEVSRIK